MQISRRGFLKVGLAGGAGVALAQASRLFGGVQTLDRLSEPNLNRDFPEEWFPSACGACAAACPIFLRKIGGNIVGVRPSEPKPCPRAYLIPQELKHPDRLLSPLKRQGERGSGSWKSISRAAAVEELAGILRDSGKKTAIVVGEDSGLSSVLLKALIDALGSHHIYTSEWTPAQGPIDALQLATGWGEWRYDLSNADGVISFGWDWLQNFPNPAEAHTAYGLLRQKNAPMIYIGPRLNLTAMKSNNWIACKTGYEPLLALSLVAMLLVEKKYDADFCESAERFAQFAESFAKFDLVEASQQTGVSVQRLRELADIIWQRGQGGLKAPLLLCLGTRGRVEDQWGVVALNALLGNFNRQGGLMPLPEVSLPPSKQVTTHPLTHSPTPFSMEELPQLLMEGDEVETVVFVGVNPASSSPSPSRWLQALKQARHVVCLTHFLDETSEFADLLLPLALPAERDEIYIEAGEGKLTPQKVERASETPTDVFVPAFLAFELASRLGVQAALPYKSLEEAADGLMLHSPSLASFRFPPPFLWSKPTFSEGEFHLILEAPSAFVRTEGARFPYLLTTVAPHLREWWTTWMELNPSTARQLGIHDRDKVVVESEAGSIDARARLYEGVPEDAICLPMGMGRKIGQFAQSEGGNPMELIEYKKDQTTGIPLYSLQKVRIKRVQV